MIGIQKILNIFSTKNLMIMVFLIAIVFSIKKRNILNQTLCRVFVVLSGKIRTIIKHLKKAIIAVLAYFRTHRMLLVLILFDVAIVVVIYANKQAFLGNAFKYAVCTLIISVVLSCEIYSEEYNNWLRKGSSFVKRFLLMANDYCIYIMPLIFGVISYHLASMYFFDFIDINKEEVELIVYIIVFLLLFVLLYCAVLHDIHSSAFKWKHRVSLFLFAIIHIIQLFVNIYILILVVDHSAFSNISSSNPLELCFDITYFSAMVFFGGNTVLQPASRWIQLAVLIETFIFAIYISMIIFNFCGKDRTDTAEKSEISETHNAFH